MRALWVRGLSSSCLLMNSRKAGRPEGFTLIEVLVATVIFAVSVAIIMQAMSVSLSTFDRSKKVLVKASLGTSIVEAILLEDRDTGEVGEVRWTSQEEPLDWDWDTGHKMRKILISVEGPRINTTFLIYRPLQNWIKTSSNSLIPLGHGPSVGR